MSERDVVEVNVHKVAERLGKSPEQVRKMLDQTSKHTGVPYRATDRVEYASARAGEAEVEAMPEPTALDVARELSREAPPSPGTGVCGLPVFKMHEGMGLPHITCAADVHRPHHDTLGVLARLVACARAPEFKLDRPPPNGFKDGKAMHAWCTAQAGEICKALRIHGPRAQAFALAVAAMRVAEETRGKFGIDLNLG